ncbi:MAG: tRNA(Met) cytidine acetyltransferase, partial [Pseudomonadales bacterium]|nr:tRNA(Met) cytidine acetyltransferase [Pseudomonadales bacterium]
EGQLDEAIAQEIVAGRRRPRGHLLVQSLAIHLRHEVFLRQRVARVVRIAVHTQYQGRGLGSQLLQAVVDRLRGRGVNAVGSSFSASAEVLHFWQKNGFELLRVGYRRHAASAEPSALVLRVLDDLSAC